MAAFTSDQERKKIHGKVASASETSSSSANPPPTSADVIASPALLTDTPSAPAKMPTVAQSPLPTSLPVRSTATTTPSAATTTTSTAGWVAESKTGTGLFPEDLVQIDTPNDHNCLFWSAALGLLLPCLEDDAAFNQMYDRLFGAGSLPLDDQKAEEIILIETEFTREGVRNILRTYDGQRDTPLEYQGSILQTLVCAVFRGRVVNTLATAFPNAAARDPILVAARIDNPRITGWEDYINVMRLPIAWGGDPEIRAISHLAQINVEVRSAGAAPVPFPFTGSTQTLYLAHVNAKGRVGGNKNHYHYGLGRTIFHQLIQNQKLRLSATTTFLSSTSSDRGFEEENGYGDGSHNQPVKKTRDPAHQESYNKEYARGQGECKGYQDGSTNQTPRKLSNPDHQTSYDRGFEEGRENYKGWQDGLNNRPHQSTLSHQASYDRGYDEGKGICSFLRDTINDAKQHIDIAQDSNDALLELCRQADQHGDGDIFTCAPGEPVFLPLSKLIALNKRLKPKLSPRLVLNVRGKDTATSLNKIYREIHQIRLTGDPLSFISEQAARLALKIILVHTLQDGNFRTAICSLQCCFLRAGLTLNVRALHVDAFIRGIAGKEGEDNITNSSAVNTLRDFLIKKIKMVPVEERIKRWREYITEGLELTELRTKYGREIPHGEYSAQQIGRGEQRNLALTDNTRNYKGYKEGHIYGSSHKRSGSGGDNSDRSRRDDGVDINGGSIILSVGESSSTTALTNGRGTGSSSTQTLTTDGGGGNSSSLSSLALGFSDSEHLKRNLSILKAERAELIAVIQQNQEEGKSDSHLDKQLSSLCDKIAKLEQKIESSGDEEELLQENQTTMISTPSAAQILSRSMMPITSTSGSIAVAAPTAVAVALSEQLIDEEKHRQGKPRTQQSKSARGQSVSSRALAESLTVAIGASPSVTTDLELEEIDRLSPSELPKKYKELTSDKALIQGLVELDPGKENQDNLHKINKKITKILNRMESLGLLPNPGSPPFKGHFNRT